jgi:hypothetical protein
LDRRQRDTVISHIFEFGYFGFWFRFCDHPQNSSGRPQKHLEFHLRELLTF